MIMLAFRRSKTVYASVVILVMASMLLTPLLESAQVKAFADNQLAQRQEAETLQQESNYLKTCERNWSLNSTHPWKQDRQR